MHKRLGLERIQMRLHAGPAHETADQRIERGQHALYRAVDLLLGDRPLDIGVDLVFFQKLKIVKPHLADVGLAKSAAAINGAAQLHPEYCFGLMALRQQLFHRGPPQRVLAGVQGIAPGHTQHGLQARAHIVQQGITLLQHRFDTGRERGLGVTRLMGHTETPEQVFLHRGAIFITGIGHGQCSDTLLPAGKPRLRQEGPEGATRQACDNTGHCSFSVACNISNLLGTAT